MVEEDLIRDSSLLQETLDNASEKEFERNLSSRSNVVINSVKTRLLLKFLKIDFLEKNSMDCIR